MSDGPNFKRSTHCTALSHRNASLIMILDETTCNCVHTAERAGASQRALQRVPCDSLTGGQSQMCRFNRGSQEDICEDMSSATSAPSHSAFRLNTDLVEV